MVGFTKENIDLANESWEKIEEYNSCLQRLIARRKGGVAIEGPFVE